MRLLAGAGSIVVALFFASLVLLGVAAEAVNLWGAAGVYALLALGFPLFIFTGAYWAEIRAWWWRRTG